MTPCSTCKLSQFGKSICNASLSTDEIADQETGLCASDFAPAMLQSADGICELREMGAGVRLNAASPSPDHIELRQMVVSPWPRASELSLSGRGIPANEGHNSFSG